MILDCPRCGDTPCDCGRAGYVVVRTADPRLPQLPRVHFEYVRAELGARLHELLQLLNPQPPRETP
jgi:hypothetical protein